MRGGPTRHFTWQELGSPPSSRRQGATQLAEALENLRSRCGDSPLRILSGYRTPKHNRAVGGAVQSQHLLGRAADIPYGYATYEEAAMSGFTGIGTRGPWAVHVDVRLGPTARWTY